MAVDSAAVLYTVGGVLLVTMAVAGSVLKRLPLTTAFLYLVVGFLLGGHGALLIDIDLVEHAPILERITEAAVIISLFTAGLKLRIPFHEDRWRVALRLATLSMAVTIAVVATVGVVVVGLPIGAAILLGAILAPTDPVLASDVQVSDPDDRDRVRTSLTGEAGLNDGTAFPFVMLGLGLLGFHDLGTSGTRWALVDLLWATVAGVGVGAVLGTLVGRFVLYLRRSHREALGLDDFLALGLVLLSYGTALLLHAYGFLAVFAAGVALRRIERIGAEGKPTREVLPVLAVDAAEEAATDDKLAASFMARAILVFNEQLERIGEVLVVLLIGAMVGPGLVSMNALVVVVILLLVARPLAVVLGLAGAHIAAPQRRLVAWFGVRGVGSVYYLTFAITHGLPVELARELGEITLAVVVASIVVHGTSVTPLMARHSQHRDAARLARAAG